MVEPEFDDLFDKPRGEGTSETRPRGPKDERKDTNN